MSRAWLPLLGAVLLFVARAAGAGADATVPDTTKPWTRWWWPGSGVDEANLTRELEMFAAAGLGGVEITPIYGAKGYEDRYVEFLSPRWMELLAHTCREAQRLGLGVDMATGTGWPFGGPWVSADDGSQKLVFADGRLQGEPTNMQVKRAAPGGEGRVLDPYSPAALERYLAPFDRAFASFPAGFVRAQFHDSFEYYESGWSPVLPDVFRAMHGYDLQDHPAALVGPVAGRGEAGPGSTTPATIDEDTLRRVKSDYRETLAKLHLDYLKTWRDWSHQHGFIVRNQSHGAPANLLDLYGAVDIPETETFGSTPFPIPGLRRDPRDVRGDQDLPDSLMIRMASSAAHVMGRPLASSETCTWLREHWKVSLAFTKPEIDRLFVDGINHILYHGTCYSPADAPWPGWLFYASTQFNNRNPWWDDFAALNEYVQRVQSVLQAGEPDNDVLLYFPFYDVIDDPDGLMKLYGVHNIGWLRDSPCGQLAQLLTDEGFSWDYISDAQLQEADLARYKVILVPKTRRMPVETLTRLTALSMEGKRVIFEDGPEDVPGLGNLEERRDRLLLGRQFASDAGLLPAIRRSHGDIVAALDQANVSREAGLAHSGLRFIRRTTGRGHAYFLTNLTPALVNYWMTIADDVTDVRWEDPLTGAVDGGLLAKGPAGNRRLFVRLAPGESRLLRTQFRGDPVSTNPTWTTLVPSGGTQPLSGRWEVSFITGGPVLPPPIIATTLSSWTEIGDESAQSFGGTARYRLEFEKPGSDADDWLLDLGDVRESARVRVNGVKIATLWSLPFRVRIGELLKPGANVLEVDVTNLAANRIRDLDRHGVEWRIMREINFVNIRYRPFDASSWELTPSGLLGPVTLTPLRRIDPATDP